MGACIKPLQISIVTELMDSDLQKFLRSPEGKALSKAQRISMARGAAKGMAWIHDICNKIHRDLKPANLLVNSQHIVKVTDFGFTETLKGNKTATDKYGPKGTFLWMAPEVMNQEEFDKSLDVYSFGLILWEIWTGIEPFGEYQDYSEFFCAVCIEHKRPELPHDAPASFNILVSSCWHRDRKMRPTFAEVVFRLAEVIVDIEVPHPGGNAFWKKNWLVPTQELINPVKFDEFSRVWSKDTGVPRSSLTHLKQFLTESKEVVSLKNFSTAINLWGPFYEKAKASLIVEEVKNTKNQAWFWGVFTSDQAASLLAQKDEGTYLIRVSVTGQFALSFSKGKGKGVQHYRINKEEEDGANYFVCGDYKQLTIGLLVDELIEVFGLMMPASKNDQADNCYQAGPAK